MPGTRLDVTNQAEVIAKSKRVHGAPASAASRLEARSEERCEVIVRVLSAI